MPTMQQTQPAHTLTKRGLLLRDSLTFLVLCAVTVTLFGLTLLLFRSFEEHRLDLGREWSEQGQQSLQQGNATAAVSAFRTALSYRPNELSDQLLLAQALADSGRTDEAIAYFLNLWEQRPGDGFVNLQLARLERKHGDAPEAVNYYRAAIFGNWEGDGVARRRQTRLELADYLASRGENAAARTEVLIAAGNAPEKEASDVMFGDKLQTLGDLPGALSFYQKALADHPHDGEALARAGRAEYGLGHYEIAAKLLSSALSEQEKSPGNDQNVAQLSQLAQNSRRLQELDLSRDLPASERATHLMLAMGIAKKRLDSCTVQLAKVSSGAGQGLGAAITPAPLLALSGRYTAAERTITRKALERDASLEDSISTLIDDTESSTASACGAPTGDDALLLMLARSSHAPGPQGN